MILGISTRYLSPQITKAVISGAFSMTRQAIQLGDLPRLKVSHTATTQIGQIYIVPVNWLLMVCTISLVAGSQSSSKLAAAYGLGVTSTMIINTVLFFAANLSKIVHGAWFPLVIGAIFFTVMLTWAKGRGVLEAKLHKVMSPMHQLIVDLTNHPPNKIEGDAVY